MRTTRSSTPSKEGPALAGLRKPIHELYTDVIEKSIKLVAPHTWPTEAADHQ